MKIIAISGKAQHGKDTLAGEMKKILQSKYYRVLIIHYGDLLKYICEKFFDWDGKKDDVGRSLLQQVGTEKIRSQEPDFWVAFVTKILRFFPDQWDYVLIPDARFPNEITYLRDNGFDVTHIRIHRPIDNKLTEAQKKHPSETALDDFPVDIHIKNDGTIADLAKKAEDILSNRLQKE